MAEFNLGNALSGLGDLAQKYGPAVVEKATTYAPQAVALIQQATQGSPAAMTAIRETVQAAQQGQPAGVIAAAALQTVLKQNGMVPSTQVATDGFLVDRSGRVQTGRFQKVG